MISINSKQKPSLFVRILPSTEFDWDCIKIDVDNKCLYIRHLYEFHSSLNVKTLPKFLCYRTNGIFSNCCQSEVYESVVNQLIDNIYLGIDSVVVSYGQNNSGKSFTMTGLYNQFELRGIVPRFLIDLFKEELNRREDFDSQIWMSAVDIEKNCVYDLLERQKKLSKLPKDVKSVKLQSDLQGLEFMFKAEALRMTIREKSYNAHSGTNVITFTVHLTPLHAHERNKSSKVHFVDLAGVETIQRNPLTSFKDKEVQGPANLSKTLLEIFALRSQKCKNLKSNQFRANQRINALTQYLDRSLSPASCIKLICHIRPNHEDIMMTLSLLKFARTLKDIPKVVPEVHSELNVERTIEGLQDTVKSLKDELLTRDMWGELSPMKITQGRLDFVRRRVELYVTGDLDEFELLSSVNDCNLILNIMKTIFRDRLSTEVTSTLQQTDDVFISKRRSDADRKGQDRRDSVLKKSIIRDKKGSISSLKQVGFENPKEIDKIDAASKGKKTDKKKNISDKPELVSQEVQVNLIEPHSELPQVDSREAVWAMFIISRPDLQVQIDHLNSLVVEKQNKLAKETLKVDDIKMSMNQTKLTLQQLSVTRAFVDEGVHDTNDPTLTNQETELIKLLKSLQNESVVHQQKLIEAQTDWLEALEKLNSEKQIIEETFKEFCHSNNYLALNNKISLQEEVEVRHSKSSTLDLPTCEEQNKYISLQQKYLHMAKT